MERNKRMLYQELKEKFAENADPEKAKQLSAYMRNQFTYYGYQTKARKDIYHQFLLNEKKKKTINWRLLDQSWQDPHREMQYFVCDYLIVMQKYLSFADMPKIEKFVRSKQWWDTIDSLIKPIGKIGLRDHRINDLMLQWSIDPDFWVRRVAIEHQLLRKDKTDQDLLAKIIENNLGSSEFFINKAIGWALRDYSKTNPAWVKSFIMNNKDKMSKLSITEGSKYLD